MTDPSNTATAEGAQLVGTPGRPGRPDEAERGEHSAESVLSLTAGAGPEQSKEDCMASPRRPARPVRFEDPARNAAYWARIDRIVDAAPPLTTEQVATLRGIFAPVVAAMTREAA
ncbi:hypothetical protein [Streptomyces tibetensis]|uniref:hypothetical protein n=1 Tax=Streptomyces tibetensis TaxID=2382123 RepID=UPI0033D4F53C